jgi:hypothetical protein
MAHFAKISENNIVLAVLTLDNVNMLDENGIEKEELGQQYLQTHNNWPAHLWIQTSYNTIGGKYYNSDRAKESSFDRTKYDLSLGDQSKAFRGNYAAIGMTWDINKNAFIPQKPYNSWVLNETTFTWESPISKPEQTYTTINGVQYPDSFTWNEGTLSWDKTEFKITPILNDDLSMFNALRL